MGDNPIYEIRDERFGAMVIGSAYSRSFIPAAAGRKARSGFPT